MIDSVPGRRSLLLNNRRLCLCHWRSQRPVGEKCGENRYERGRRQPRFIFGDDDTHKLPPARICLNRVSLIA